MNQKLEGYTLLGGSCDPITGCAEVPVQC